MSVSERGRERGRERVGVSEKGGERKSVTITTHVTGAVNRKQNTIFLKATKHRYQRVGFFFFYTSVLYTYM